MLALAVTAGAALLPLPVSAGAATATTTLAPGTLGFVKVPALKFKDTLDGHNQTATFAQAIDVGDATGSGVGWDITVTSTTFTVAGHTLPTTATTLPAAPAVACDAGVTCTLASPSGRVTYPYTVPAAATAPTATRLFSAAAATGLGDQTVTPTWSLAIPANTYSGKFKSTWTFSLVSGP